MKKIVVTLALLASTACFAQPPADCKPNELNVPGAPYPCIFPDHRAMFRIDAPEAQKVRVRAGNPGVDLAKGPDGLWYGTTSAPLVEGFHYYLVSIDGATVSDPATQTFFGGGIWSSAIEVPAHDADFYSHKQVPHGLVRDEWYFSTVTQKWRRAMIYTPPGYDTNTKMKYPVLYLLHGWGENELGWTFQGHVDQIMDNLLAEGKTKPFLIVMDNLNACKPDENCSIYNARGTVTQAVPQANAGAPGAPGVPGAGFGGGQRPAGAPGAAGARPAGAPPAGGARPAGGPMIGPTFSEMLITDLIPMVEKNYRVIPGRDNRAMAGLSMGGMQTFTTGLQNLDKFAYLGGLSGNCGGRGANFDPKTSCSGAFADPAKFNKEMKVLFLSTGSVEGPGVKSFSDTLTKDGINNVYFEPPGTAHEWLSWRRAFADFAPRLFR